MAVRGIRGATTADADTQTAVIEATTEMLQSISSGNRLDPADIAGVWFTTTRDLTAEFPAVAVWARPRGGDSGHLCVRMPTTSSQPRGAGVDPGVAAGRGPCPGG